MLRIYEVCLDVVRLLRKYLGRISQVDPELGRQLKRSMVSMTLNCAEGSGNRGGRRRLTYEIALGEAREVRACLEVAEAAGYLDTVDPALLDKLDR